VLVTGVALTANLDKSLELVATSLDETGSPGPVWHAWQTTPAGHWSFWQQLAIGEPASGGWGEGPAVAQAADGCLEAVVVGSDRAMWHARQPNPGVVDWEGWTSLKRPGGQQVISEPVGARPAIATPVLARNADGRLEVFVVRRDQTVWHRWHTHPAPAGDWSAWDSLGPPGDGTVGPLAVGTLADGRLELFALDLAGAIRHRWQDPASEGGWSPESRWHSLSPDDSPQAFRGPVVASNADRHLELFIVAHEGGVWHRGQRREGGWSSWRSLGSIGEGFIDVGVGTHADGRLVLFAATEKGELFYQEQIQPNNRWRGIWAPFSHPMHIGSLDTLAKAVTLASNADGGLELFLLLPTGRICEFRQKSPNGDWSDATLWSSPEVGAPTVPEKQY
jgi:hypothetical protein